MSLALSGDGSLAGVTAIGDVSSTELGYLDGVTSAIQSQINTAGGLVKITDQSFSAASAVNVNNCFSSTYDDYFITFRATHSATQVEVNWRARVSGSDETSSNYNHRMLLAQSSTVSTTSTAGATAGVWCAISTNDVNVSSGWVFGPNLTKRTQTITKGNYDNNIREHNTDLNTTTAYTGITFTVPSGTMTGTVRVYGYRD